MRSNLSTYTSDECKVACTLNTHIPKLGNTLLETCIKYTEHSSDGLAELKMNSPQSEEMTQKQGITQAKATHGTVTKVHNCEGNTLVKEERQHQAVTANVCNTLTNTTSLMSLTTEKSCQRVTTNLTWHQCRLPGLARCPTQC